MKIRKATVADFESVLNLIREFSIFQKTPEKVSITLEQMKEDVDIFQCFVVESEQHEIIGFASFFFSYHSWSGKSLYLDDLYIAEQHRGLQLGNELMQYVIEYARQNKCKSMRWVVSRWNDKAIGFYKKIGAEINDVEVICELKI